MSTGTISLDEETRSRRALSAPDRAGSIPADSPGWFQRMQADAWTVFEQTPLPTRNDEPWRFASIKSLNLAPYQSPAPVGNLDVQNLLARSTSLGAIAGKMIFANGELLQHEFSADLEERGVIFQPLEQAASDHEELFRRHFMTQEVILGSRKFAALHQARVRSGNFLYVPPGVEIELPLESFHWLHGENGSVYPHTLIIAGENSRVTFVEHLESADPEAPGLACGVNDLFLGRGAQLTYVCVQNWSKKVLSFQINSTVVERDASAKSMNLNLGSAFARNESVSRLIGAGGRSEMLALSIGTGQQEFDQRTLQDHQQPNTASDLLYKNSLDDRARTIFAGLIRVEPHAHRTDAYQKVRNLLLSDDAEANSMPGLEILADEVRCSHGATSGQIDDEQLFYLASRGIPLRVAQHLIVFGFFAEVLERLKNEPVAAALRRDIAQKFASPGA